MEKETEETMTCDCGHEVPKSQTVSVPEVLLCEECYKPHPVEKWPKVICSKKSYAGQNYHGHAEYHKTQTVILGLDRRGRAVYWGQSDSRLKYAVPKNDHAYRQDRESAEERLGRELRPEMVRHVGPEPDPGYSNSYHTLPNGDHIVIVESVDGPFREYEYRELKKWLHENTDEWQSMHPEMVERFDLEDRFGTHSGQPLTRKECEECGHEQVVDPVEYVDCPECGSYKFRGVVGEQ